ncbi:uncharacterized protein PRCAT00002844001 [Priceomyces carsonii]|uniref:uncharacterized protein n=1 Tax=Priceomyces carsonii TaxID=28549 RepID=UPI002EDAB063|nr:unnamed protein product [Priceomyces carsonii]
MLVPKNLDICPKLWARSFTGNVTSTADAFKSWDTCMDNRACKIIAIVGIVLAGLLLIWILSSIFRCCVLGVTCVQAFCCCCAGCGSRRPRRSDEEMYYTNPNMYAHGPPLQRSQPQRMYEPALEVDDESKEYYERKNPFQDTSRTYRGNTY